MTINHHLPPAAPASEEERQHLMHRLADPAYRAWLDARIERADQHGLQPVTPEAVTKALAELT